MIFKKKEVEIIVDKDQLKVVYHDPKHRQSVKTILRDIVDSLNTMYGEIELNGLNLEEILNKLNEGSHLVPKSPQVTEVYEGGIYKLFLIFGIYNIITDSLKLTNNTDLDITFKYNRTEEALDLFIRERIGICTQKDLIDFISKKLREFNP